MPVVTIEMFRGRSIEQKRALVRAITDAMAQHADANPEQLIVIIHELERDAWARNGQLVADRDRETAAH